MPEANKRLHNKAVYDNLKYVYKCIHLHIGKKCWLLCMTIRYNIITPRNIIMPAYLGVNYCVL